MTRFVTFIVEHHLLVLVLAVVAAIAGAISWQRLPVDAFPDVTNQQVMILTEAEGLAPLDVEQQITFPIESVMGGLPRVKLVRSLSKSALSQVVVVFEDDVDTYFARQLVFERLQLARDQLPPGVEPEMGPIATGLGEVFQYTLESDRHDLTELRTLQDWLIAPRLRALGGVNEVNSFGGMVKQYHVLIEPERLLKYGLTLDEIVEAVAANNHNAGGGFVVEEWEQENVRSVGLYGEIEDIENIVLLAEDGTPVYLADVAEITLGHLTRLGGVTRDGKGEVVAGMVIMLKDANAREVVARVKEALPSLESALPEGAKIDVFYDRTELVRAVVSTVSSALLQGAGLVVVVLFLLIGNLRGALVVALSLPVTALIAFVLMDASSVSANLMSLGGLAIAIGMVVDGSIVVTENVTRHLQSAEGRAARARAVVAAVAEVGRPIVFAILIIALVFLPLFSLEGMEGKMFAPLAKTMIFAMLASLIVALTLVPALLNLLSRWRINPREPKLLGGLRRAYLRVLDTALRRRAITVTIAAVLLAGSLALAPLVGSEFLPTLDEGAIAINVVRLPNASLDGSVATSEFIERQLLEFPEVATVVSKSGRAEISEDPMGPEQTDVLVMLEPEDEWSTGRDKQELVAAIQAHLSTIPGLRLAFSQPIALRVNELISGVKSDLAIKVFGPELEPLKQAADDLAARLRGIEGAKDVSVEQVTGLSQLEIVPDRRAMARYQLNMLDINEIVETGVGGKVATTVIEGQKRFDVLVRFPAERRDDEEALRSILVTTPQGARVPLGQIAELRRVEGPAQISRENGMRRVVVEANVRGRDLGGFVDEARAQLAPVLAEMPDGYWLEYGGTFANQQRAMRRLSIVVPASIVLIFLMLVTGLRSFKAGALVLINLPFALVGGLLSMLAFGIDLNVPATVGFIALFGTAVQNGTVLVTFVEQLRGRGTPLRQAIVEGCSLRFRALLMTAATTVLGLTPMIYASGPGAEIQRPLAVVVIGGLVTATLLTLLVLPTIYYWVNLRGARAAEAHAASSG